MPKVVKQTAKRRSAKRAAVDSAWPSDNELRINVYGRSGTGKTSFWATFPKPILAIICSGGNKPGELRSIDTPEYRKSVHPKMCRSSDDFIRLLDEAKDYATVVLDHATGLQDVVLKEILGLEKIPEQLSWGLATQQQYGQLALQVKERFRQLLSLPCNVVIVAQEREFNTDSESSLVSPYVASALTPSVVGWLNPACDYICQTFIRPRAVVKKTKLAGKVTTKEVRVPGKVDYCLRVGPDGTYTTKFRMPKGSDLPVCIVDPTYDKVRKLIEGG